MADDDNFADKKKSHKKRHSGMNFPFLEWQI
jgi:hypothetical protein